MVDVSEDSSHGDTLRKRAITLETVREWTRDKVQSPYRYRMVWKGVWRRACDGPPLKKLGMQLN